MPLTKKIFIAIVVLIACFWFYLDAVPVLGKGIKVSEELIDMTMCNEILLYGNIHAGKDNLGVTEAIYNLQNFPCLFYETENGSQMIQNLDMWDYDIIPTEDTEKIERWEIVTVYRLGFIKKAETHDYYKIFVNKEEAHD